MNDRPAEGALAPRIYGVVDLLVAALYLYLFIWLVPSRTGGFTPVGVGMALVSAAAGVGMLMGQRGRKLAALCSGVLVAVCVVLVALLLMSIAYLHGIYGGVGQAGVALGSIIVLITIQVVGFVPGLQLAYLWRTRPRQQEQ